MLLNHDGVPARLMKEPETLNSDDLMLNLAANEVRTYPSADEAWSSRHPMCIVLERGTRESDPRSPYCGNETSLKNSGATSP